MLPVPVLIETLPPPVAMLPFKLMVAVVPPATLDWLRPDCKFNDSGLATVPVTDAPTVIWLSANKFRVAPPVLPVVSRADCIVILPT